MQRCSATTFDDLVSKSKDEKSPSPTGYDLKTSLKLEEAVDVKSISMDDLSKLKEKDPFLYYSIPEVRHAKLIEGTDISQARDEAQVNDAQSLTVARRSRISFECHPALCDGFLSLSTDSEADSDDCDESLDVLVARLNFVM